MRGELEVERTRSHNLLLNVLPQPIIDRLNEGQQLIADRYDDVAIVFSDFVGFTEISGRLPVADLVDVAQCALLDVRRRLRSARRREDQDHRRRLPGSRGAARHE